MVRPMTKMQRQRLLFSGHLKMSWIHQNQKDGVFPPSPPSYSDAHRRDSFNPSSSGSKISPAVLFIIVILAVLFFIAGLLHLLVRFLTKNNTSSSSSSNRNHLGASSTSEETLQRQLQQLFHLHDSGLDQAFIDALPVFSYKEVVGPKEPFDCAVCLSEFSETDRLRLLPTCSHAFHINCIDTWLLSNSTCPLCRNALFNPEFPMENPAFDYQDFREEEGCPNYRENGFFIAQKKAEIEEIATEKGIFPVRLGKFRKLNNQGGANEEGMVGESSSSSSNLDARRCYSMGSSYQYVVGDAKLRVSALSRNKNYDALNRGPSEQNRSCDDDGKKITAGAKDSYSVSKIWLWPKKGGRFAGGEEDNPSLGLP